MHNSEIVLDFIANHDSSDTHPSSRTINTESRFPGVKSEVEQIEMTTQFQQFPKTYNATIATTICMLLC